MLNRIYNTLKFFTNNEVQGNVTPTEFNIAVHNRVNQIYEGYFDELNKYINRQNRGLITNGYGDIPEKIHEKISHYLDVEIISEAGISRDGDEPSQFAVPDECRWVDLILNNANNREIENCESPERFRAVNRVALTAPTVKNPIGHRMSGYIYVYPNTIEEIRMYYLRNPIEANWTYTVVDGVELYDPSNALFRDVDIHPSEEYNLTILVLKSFGINLKEQELVKIVSSEEWQEFQKKNSA